MNIAGQIILAFLAGLMLADVIAGNASIPIINSVLFFVALSLIAAASFRARLYAYGFGALFGAICWFTIGALTL